MRFRLCEAARSATGQVGRIPRSAAGTNYRRHRRKTREYSTAKPTFARFLMHELSTYRALLPIAAGDEDDNEPDGPEESPQRKSADGHTFAISCNTRGYSEQERGNQDERHDRAIHGYIVRCQRW